MLKKQIIFDIIYSILLGLGIILIFSSLFLNWWIHGDYNRYLWIINGPDPYNKFGSGPYQIVIFISLFLIGIIITLIALFLKGIIYKKAG